MSDKNTIMDSVFLCAGHQVAEILFERKTTPLSTGTNTLSTCTASRLEKIMYPSLLPCACCCCAAFLVIMVWSCCFIFYIILSIIFLICSASDEYPAVDHIWYSFSITDLPLKLNAKSMLIVVGQSSSILFSIQLTLYYYYRINSIGR